mmetsp:Transcript_637/g.2448  ORF Transcript_637/g.2448 Transcript_637/m.2448 type:complete len:207 (+) Transcript_637:156-776(+)
MSSEQPPPEQEEHEHEPDDHRDGRVLLNQRLPAEILGSRAVFPTLVPQRLGHRANVVQTLALAEDIVDVARHDALYVVQILVEFTQVALRARVLVQLLGFLDEGVELDEGVRARHRLHGGAVLRRELPLQILQVLVRQLLGVPAVAQREVTHALLDHVVQEVRAGLVAHARGGGRARGELLEQGLRLLLVRLQVSLTIALQPLREG